LEPVEKNDLVFTKEGSTELVEKIKGFGFSGVVAEEEEVAVEGVTEVAQ